MGVHDGSELVFTISRIRKPELAVVQAGKLMLFEIKKCVNSNVTFAFETTLSGRGYEKKSSSGKISVMK